jgi:DNA-binding CsgD family transcriptional regulator
LIGRAAELATLHQLIDQAKGGHGQVALLSGEAGIGKTRLVAEAKTYAAAHDFLLMQGNCFPADLSCPYAPLLDLLRTFAVSVLTTPTISDGAVFPRELAPLLPDLAPLAPDQPLASASDPEQEKRRLFAALAQFFIGQASSQAVLFIIEDLHWSDETSLEFLHFLARHCSAAPVLIFLTYRNDEAHPSLIHYLALLDRERLAQEVALAPLTHAEVGAMLQAILELRRSVFVAPPPGQRDLLDALYPVTEGNPFLIEELLKSLIEAGDIVHEQGRWRSEGLRAWHLPRSVQDAVEQRTAHLSAGAKRVLHLAAVAGRHFDFALLQELIHQDEAQLLRLLKELIAAQLVVEESEDRFAFRHALTRQAVYTQLLGRERKALHRTIAETIERLNASTIEAHLAELASHFSAAGAWEQALTYGQRAGEQAQTLYALRSATLHFTRALEAARQLALPLPARLYRARGLAYETLGDFEQARSDQDAALQCAREASDRQGEWQALLDLGALWAGRNYAQAGGYYQQALAVARALDDPAALAHSLNRLGNWYLNVEQPQEALHCHQEALATFQALNDPRGKAVTLDFLGMTNLLGGDLGQSAVYAQQAITILRELDDRQRLISSMATLMLCGGNYQNETLVPAGDYAESLKLGELALRIAGEIGQRPAEAYTLIHMAMCLGPRGEFARAFEVAQRGLAIAEETEHRQWMTAGHRALGALCLDLLALSEAKLHLEQALALAHEVGSQYWTRIASGFLALVSIAQHEAPRAESLLNDALGPDGPAQTVGQRMIWYARAELALARNDPPRALHITDQLLASAPGLAMGVSIPRISMLRGEALAQLKQTAEAVMNLQQARATAVQRGLRPLVWRIDLTLGKLAHAQRKYEEAERRFAAARELIEDLASDLPTEPYGQRFLRQAQALFPRTRQPSALRLTKKTFEGLTQRERAVAALIGNGKSNREIADLLVVAPRTIETHVSSILSKLGCASRTQIAIWAREKGLSGA